MSPARWWAEFGPTEPHSGHAARAAGMPCDDRELTSPLSHPLTSDEVWFSTAAGRCRKPMAPGADSARTYTSTTNAYTPCAHTGVLRAPATLPAHNSCACGCSRQPCPQEFSALVDKCGSLARRKPAWLWTIPATLTARPPHACEQDCVREHGSITQRERREPVRARGPTVPSRSTHESLRSVHGDQRQDRSPQRSPTVCRRAAR